LEANKYIIRLDNSVKMVLFKAICRPITKVTIINFLKNFHEKNEIPEKNQSEPDFDLLGPKKLNGNSFYHFFLLLEIKQL
jgi:hypothetical protein